MAFLDLITSGGSGGNQNQPIANIVSSGVFVQGDNTYRGSKSYSFSDSFSADGGTLTCQKAGTYLIKGSAFFRYSYLYARKNGTNFLTVNGYSQGTGNRNVESEIEQSFLVGDTLTAAWAGVNYVDTRFANGEILVFEV